MEEHNLSSAEINFFKQLQFEKKNLEDKVSYLESRLSTIEENHELILSNLTLSQNNVKSLENKLNLVRQDLKEKENIIDTSEFYKEKISEAIQNLSIELKSLKKILKQQNHTEDIEMLKVKLCDLEKLFSQHAKEKSKLEFELNSMSEELLFHISNEGNLAKQIKKLENEKLELKVDHKTLLHEVLEDEIKSIDIYERFLTTTPDWDSSMPDLNLDGKNLKTYNEALSLIPFNVEHNNENLWKEIYDVEKNGQKEILRKEMQEKNEGKCVLKKFGTTIKDFENSERNYQDYQLLAFYFPDILNTLQESLNLPESHSKQCNVLPEKVYANVTGYKDVIQIKQPESFPIVKTVSTSSQTEVSENISPIFFQRLPQKSHMKENDFEEKVQYFFRQEEEIKNKKNCQFFFSHKNCDLDMDIYRSCRKLSVLPEEEIDDVFTKKNGLESSYSLKQDYFQSKDYFSEDFRNTQGGVNRNLNEISLSNLFIKHELSQKDLLNTDNNLNVSYLQKTKLNLVDNELLMSIMSPRDKGSRQRSFDSYLDPLNFKKSALLRQISDPSQTTVCTPSSGRRLIKVEGGSLMKKTGSTCRPLRLPYDKDREKKDRKMYKVRFNVPEQILSTEINFKEMTSNPFANKKSNKNFSMISTFRIDTEDKISFHKFLEKNFSSNDENKNFIYFKGTKIKSVLDGNSKVFKKCFCDTVEGLYTVKLDVDFSDRNDEVNQFCHIKKRKISDSLYLSADNNPKIYPSLENNHSSLELDIPCINIEDLPIIKNTCDSSICSLTLPQNNLLIARSFRPDLRADSNLNKFLPAYVSGQEELFEMGSSNLVACQYETTQKNVDSFELVNFSFSDTNIFNEIVPKDNMNFDFQNKEKKCEVEKEINSESLENEEYENGYRASFDVSEGSESDTLTYKTVNTHWFPSSSDCDSDVYFTIWSDRSSLLERKSSDFSEDSSSSYTTPPDTSSSSFCTPPDNYSPIGNSLKPHPY